MIESRSITRVDVREGRIKAKVLDGGVIVSPGLQVNCRDPVTHQDELAGTGQFPLTREQMLRIYPDQPSVVARLFGLDIKSV